MQVATGWLKPTGLPNAWQSQNSPFADADGCGWSLHIYHSVEPPDQENHSLCSEPSQVYISIYFQHVPLFNVLL
jgi:hypothetical protein